MLYIQHPGYFKSSSNKIFPVRFDFSAFFCSDFSVFFLIAALYSRMISFTKSFRMTFYVLFCPQISHIIESFQVWNFVLEGSVVQFLDRLTRNILDFLKILVRGVAISPIKILAATEYIQIQGTSFMVPIEYLIQLHNMFIF